jgi:hypothetical protein
MVAFRFVIGKKPDFDQRCALCNSREAAPYRFSPNYITELAGNPNRDCLHLNCLEQRQVKLQRFPFIRVTLDGNWNYCTEPFTSDNEIVVEDTPDGRAWIKDYSGSGLPFFWEGRQFFVEPKRSEWIEEHTTYPRNILFSLDDNRWWIYLPKNQGLMYKLTWGGETQDA